MSDAEAFARGKLLIAFNKPYGVLCQFRAKPDKTTLAAYIKTPRVYPAGRLDEDSEGLLLLTGDGGLQYRLTHPSQGLEKTYLAQVERIPTQAAITALCTGVPIKGGPTRAAKVALVAEPEWLWPRDPPIRHRLRVPTAWLELRIREGRNRQVRRMTAAAGHPTLRLIRVAIGPYRLDGLRPGELRHIVRDPNPGRGAPGRGTPRRDTNDTDFA